MSNTNPLWKVVLLAVVLVVGLLFALPNLFGSDPAVQISARGGGELGADSVAEVRAAVEEAGLTADEYREEEGRLLVLFPNEDEQLKARDAIVNALNLKEHIISLNLVPAGPAWLRSFAEPMYLGLDLRGGVHFLMEVDMSAAIASAEERFVP
ncbi:MAG: protein translocase subunit SecD, partial [Gammaproteobacteria bacterium]